jgi:hypothetical protein
METTGRAGAEGAPSAVTAEGVPSTRRTVDGYLQASFPWYGLDEAFTGPRWLMQVGTAAAGTVRSLWYGVTPAARSSGSRSW